MRMATPLVFDRHLAWYPEPGWFDTQQRLPWLNVQDCP
jgi:hypothetical protein